MTLYPALGFFSMPGFSLAEGGWHSALLWHVSPSVILCPVSQHPGLAPEGNQCSLTAVPAQLPTLWPRVKHWWGVGPAGILNTRQSTQSFLDSRL